MREKLTIKQKMVLECLNWFIEEHGYSPTYRELAEELGCGIDPVYKKVSILMDKGYIKGELGKSRTLRVVKDYD